MSIYSILDSLDLEKLYAHPVCINVTGSSLETPHTKISVQTSIFTDHEYE